ncbi:hypothetical protein VTK26DRAFT_7361 [Humicola hyalothermophila]
MYINGRAVSETVWKWKYKLRHLGKSGEKTLSDFSSVESDDGLGKAAKAGKKNKVGVALNGDSSKNGEVGTNLSVKTLYEGSGSHGDSYDWVDYPPKQLSKSAARAQDRVAIKVFKVKDLSKPVMSGRYSLRYHMIQVQNPLLVECLGEVLKKQDAHLDASDIATFHHPFRELYFGYDDIAAKYRSLDETDPSSPLKPFLLLLVRLLDEVLGDTRQKVAALRAEGLITHKLAWTLFPRGATVVSWAGVDGSCEVLFKVTGTSYVNVAGAEWLAVEGQVVRFDGRRFVWDDTTVRIPPFAGCRPVAELPAYPLEYYKSDSESPGGLKERLAARGRKVLDYQGLTYASYSGIAIQRCNNKVQRLNVDGRVLVDVVGYKKHHLAQGLKEGKDPQAKKRFVVEERGADGEGEDKDGGGGDGDDAAGGAKRLGAAAQERNKKALMAKEEEEPLLMYMVPLIEGYALKNKLWVSFFVEDIRPVAWNDEAFDHLVYDEQQKDLVMSFVESHCGRGAGVGGGGARAKALEDVIAGKGQGLVMLLSGPPGTGKTLMAEAVADRARRPLFYLQAEDLGISAAVLGENLKKVFQMATEWNAVILLDEADVFMAERHPQDLGRNELVSIFLRELEYFKGVIFLTTNLYRTIDSAFRSRVSLHLLFNALTPEARTRIWRKFLDRLPPPPPGLKSDTSGGSNGSGGSTEEGDGRRQAGGTLTDEDVEELGAWQLNGREIKTAVKMTKTWCDHKGYELTLARLENGIRVTSPHATKSSRAHDTSLYDE